MDQFLSLSGNKSRATQEDDDVQSDRYKIGIFEMPEFKSRGFHNISPVTQKKILRRLNTLQEIMPAVIEMENRIARTELKPILQRQNCQVSSECSPDKNQMKSKADNGVSNNTTKSHKPFDYCPTIRWGKYKGMLVSELPEDYVLWCISDRSSIPDGTKRWLNNAWNEFKPASDVKMID